MLELEDALWRADGPGETADCYRKFTELILNGFVGSATEKRVGRRERSRPIAVTAPHDPRTVNRILAPST